MGFPARFLVFLFFVSISTFESTAVQFNCSRSGTTCNSIIDFVPPNSTTLARIVTLFGVDSLQSLLGANGLPLSTPGTRNVSAPGKIKIPFQCICRNGTGMSNRRPVYRVVSGDDLDRIATQVFGRLVTYQEIQAANNIPDASLIQPGQELHIPLPCSCDEVDGRPVVHYGYMVARGESVAGIASQFDTSGDTLLRLNGLTNPNDLMANVSLDVPLRACSSMVRNTSIDHPLLLATGTYAFTAANCVFCNCSASNNWNLQCRSSGNRPSGSWTTCPSMSCGGAENLSLGNFTSTTCNRTTCSYAGFTNQTIFTTLHSVNTCPGSPSNFAPKMGLQGWRWSFIHLLLLSLLAYL